MCNPSPKTRTWLKIILFYRFVKLVNIYPEGVKWKVVKDVHCPPLLIDTDLVSLQKHRPLSYSKKLRKLALSPRSLTESSAEKELSRPDVHCDGLCGLMLITSSENYEKGGCETWSALPFLRSHCLYFFRESQFGVIAVYRWMFHEYRKQNQNIAASSNNRGSCFKGTRVCFYGLGQPWFIADSETHRKWTTGSQKHTHTRSTVFLIIIYLESLENSTTLIWGHLP